MIEFSSSNEKVLDEWRELVFKETGVFGDWPQRTQGGTYYFKIKLTEEQLEKLKFQRIDWENRIFGQEIRTFIK